MKIKAKLLLPIALTFVIGMGIYLPVTYSTMKKQLTVSTELTFFSKAKKIRELFEIHLDDLKTLETKIDDESFLNEFQNDFHTLIRKTIYLVSTGKLAKLSKGYQNVFGNASPFIFNSEEVIIYYADEKKEGKVSELIDMKTGESLLPKMMVEGVSKITYSYTKKEEEGLFEKVALISYFEPLDYYVVYSYYEEDIHSLVMESWLVIAVPAVIMLFFILLFSFISINSVSKKIIITKDVLKNISEGDGDLTKEIEITTKDELGDLSTNFNKFSSKLKKIINNVKNESSSIEKNNISVSSATEETSAAIEEISSNLLSIKNQIESLDNNLDEMVESISKVNSRMNLVDTEIIDQSSMVEESTAAITEMIASLSSVDRITKNKKESTTELLAVSKKGREDIEKTSNAFDELLVFVEKIKEMADVINNIAAQTNLLSMNAAIEAAHAGDAGKGFAVVAEEIRKLADSSVSSSKSIFDVIKKINKSVSETSENVNTTSSSFNIISEKIDDTISSFIEIEESVSELAIGGKQVLEASEQINEVTGNIKENSSNIKIEMKELEENSEKVKTISKAVFGGISESQTGSTEIVSSMMEVKNLVSELSESVINMQKEMKKFKT